MAPLARLLALLRAVTMSYDSPIPLLTPPTTVHVAIVANSINGTLGLNLPCIGPSGGTAGQIQSTPCQRRRRLLTALTSFAGVALRQSSSQGLFLPANTDQLRWLHRLAAVRPGLTIKHHANATIWEVMAAMRLPLSYVQYDMDKNHDSLAAARMATSRLNATMLDATLVAEAEAHGWKPAATVRAANVTWSADVREMTAQRVLDEWIASMPEASDLGLEQFTQPENPYQFMNDAASAWALTSWGPVHRLPVSGMPALADKYLQSMKPDALLFGNCHSDGRRESTMVRNTSLQSKILTVSEGDSNVPFYSSFRTSDTSALRQTNTNRRSRLPPNKHYVSFQLTDGDALDYTLGGNEPSKLTFWADPSRGKFPIGWSASGQMRDLIQPLMESVYAEATPFDEHFTMDGYGYGAPSLMSEEARRIDAQRTLGAASDLNMSMVAMFSIDGDHSWEEVAGKWAPYAAGSLPLLEFWRQDQPAPDGSDGSACYVANNYTQRGALKWIGDTPVLQPRAALWSGGKLTSSNKASAVCPGLNHTRPSPPCPKGWWEKGGGCFQGCPSGSTKRDPESQRCYCEDGIAADVCSPGLTCMSVAGKAKKQCVNCDLPCDAIKAGPACVASPFECVWSNGVCSKQPHPGQCFDQPSLVKFLNAQAVDPSSAHGYSVVPVHVWAYNVTQLADVVRQLDDKVELVTPSELAYLIRTNVVKRS